GVPRTNSGRNISRPVPAAFRKFLRPTSFCVIRISPEKFSRNRVPLIALGRACHISAPQRAVRRPSPALRQPTYLSAALQCVLLQSPSCLMSPRFSTPPKENSRFASLRTAHPRRWKILYHWRKE